MKPILLKLKGFKGIRSGSGNDQVEINLSEAKGLVAIAGPNGAGKTTILDNLHPYRIMPYRAGSYSCRSFSYYNECYGTDASKELEFELNGRRFRSLVLIDTERKKQEAYLYEKQQDDSWQPLCDGKVDNYNKTVSELLGLPQLFFTSVFRCQDAYKISDYTKGEIKDIFVELLGIELLKQKGQKAKEIKDTLLLELHGLRKEYERLNVEVRESEKANSEMETIQKNLDGLENQFKDIENDIEKTQGQLQRLKAEMAVQEQAFKEKRELENKSREVQRKINSFMQITVKADEIKKASDEEKSITAKIDLLRKEYFKVDDVVTRLHELLSELNGIETEIAIKQNKLSELKLKRQHRLNSVKNDLDKAKNSSGLLKKVPCGNDLYDKCPLLGNAVKATESIPELTAEAYKLQNETEEEKKNRVEIQDLKSKVVSIAVIKKKLDDSIKRRNDIGLKVNRSEKLLLKARELSKLLPEIDLAEKCIPELELELKNIQKKLTTIKTNGDLKQKAQAVAGTLQILQQSRKDIMKKGSELRQSLGANNTIIKQGASALSKITTIAGKVENLNKDISDWAILGQALGNDGIIALEIDDAGPTISAIANDLLLSCFGFRFSVRIDTQVAKSNGKGLKETFDVVVFDSLRNESKSLRTMSGGEKVWIEEAITRAISLYNAQKSGRIYQTLFTDEKDGSLDYQKKKEFIAMKKKVLEIGGYDVEFFISQSLEVQEVADYTISINEDGVSIE